MKTVFVKDTPEKIGKDVTLYGWVSNIRDHKKIVFVDLRDSTGIVQIVGKEDFKSLSPEDVVEIKGTVKKRPENLVNKKLETGEIEIEATSVETLSKSQTLPFDMGKEELDVTLPTLLDYRSLTLRHPKVSSIFKVQETVIDGFRESLKRKKFVEFQSPVIIPEVAEGGADVFKVTYFEYSAYLSQSPQFYKQILTGVFERVFTVNKTLRAEPSVTTRHLAEITTLDAEVGFIKSWEEIMDLAESVIKEILKDVEKRNAKELELHKATVPMMKGAIPRIKLREAQEIIFKRTGRDNRNEPDLEPEDERELCKWAAEEKESELVFVTHYPTSKRPFYTMDDPENPEYTLSFDLLGRGMEWLTGGQRVNDLTTLVKKAEEKGVDIKKSDVYLQAFKYGMPPEGGFSFGSERIVMGILGLANVREASLFPRDMERIDVRLSKTTEK